MVKTSCECGGFKCFVKGGGTEVNRRLPGSNGEEQLKEIRVIGNGKSGPFTIEKCPIAKAKAEKTS